MDRAGRAETLRRWAREAGFDRAGVAALDPFARGPEYVRWLERGDHAGMGWLERRVEARLKPARVLAGARSALCVALRYHPLAGEEEPAGDLWPRVARYEANRQRVAPDGSSLATANAVWIVAR